ncbi:GDSL-type esterase/lipase family protein [Celeribacter indicus]|uniref:Lysophospholipase n=1 Tax=Celeribacter indicus TaxID=1208324 RepID=A0A0B5DTZ4_9RHOB|nr:GDSL-type esterase/lipase family protein [Celeribacter indicus]AJE46928.1 Lysophospholipase [Celeribacter indicus]SDW78412.1 Lysophospholipase L1 [Celeribacter indicus]
MRICFFGDSFTQGVGDDRGLGWCGRLTPRMRGRHPDLTAYALGIRRDTSAEILARWESEARARLPHGHPHRLAFCFGTNDCADDGTGRGRVSPAETLRNATAILAGAAAMAPVILVGPPPALDDPAVDRRIAALEPGLGAVAKEAGIPFLSVFGTLRQAPAWTAGAAAGDGTHPAGAGYALLADLIGDWPAFRHWADIA